MANFIKSHQLLKNYLGEKHPAGYPDMVTYKLAFPWSTSRLKGITINLLDDIQFTDPFILYKYPYFSITGLERNSNTIQSLTYLYLDILNIRRNWGSILNITLDWEKW